MKVIQTPRITGKEEYTERGPYTENVLTLDARLLQDLFLEDGPDSNYMELPQPGTGTVFITLLTHQMINSEDMRLPWEVMG